MSEASPEETSGPAGSDGGIGAVASPGGMSPYATGGGGVTFERKVAAQYLAHLLVGDGASELGHGRCVVSVAFQQAPGHPVDDLVVSAALPDELEPSLVLELGVRRSPDLVLSNESTRRLIREFVRAVINAPADGPERRLGLVVAGPQQHAEQLATLADLAAVQMDAPGFFDLVRTPNKFDAGIRGRLDQFEKLVKHALQYLGAEPDTALVQQRAWQLLSRLSVLMPRIESPDCTDWLAVANSLIPVARGSNLTGASRLRDRLVALASEYSPRSARVDLTLLRRDAHPTLDATARRHQQGWQVLDHIHDRALASVRDEITAGDGARRVRLDRSDAAAKLVATAADTAAVVVSGESGVGKSALPLLSFTAADPDTVQALCINLRQVPKLTVEFEAMLGCPLSTLLRELGAPQRLLITRAAIHTVKPDNIATFLGRKLNGHYQDEMGNRFNTRIEGTRLKHTMGAVSIKIYDKFGLILRIETTVLNVSFFKHYREVEHRDGSRSMAWAHMKKSIYSLAALRELLAAANRRYLEFISTIEDERVGTGKLRKISRTAQEKHRSYRGFQNKDLRRRFQQKSSGQISRLVKRLRVHGLIKKIGRTYKYYLTTLGRQVIAVGLKLKQLYIIPELSLANAG